MRPAPPAGAGDDPPGQGRRAFLRRASSLYGAVLAPGLAPALASALLGCDVREYARSRGAKLRLSIATGPVGGAYYVYGGGLAKILSSHLQNVEATAEVTSASVDNLKFLHDGKADLALVTGPPLHDAYRGEGRFARFGRVPASALAMLYTSPVHIVTLADRAINAFADLRGRVVSTGGPGSGTEDIAFRMLEAAGVHPTTGIRQQALAPGPAADALRDGKLDAFIWTSGVPAAPILDLAVAVGGRMRLVPSAELLPALRQRYGESLFHEFVLPRDAYPGMDADVRTIGVANLLVADASMSEPLAHDITTALFGHRDELVAIHAEAKNLRLESAVVGSPVPFHPGAVRYYREQGAWTAS